MTFFYNDDIAISLDEHKEEAREHEHKLPATGRSALIEEHSIRSKEGRGTDARGRLCVC